MLPHTLGRTVPAETRVPACNKGVEHEVILVGNDLLLERSIGGTQCHSVVIPCGSSLSKRSGVSAPGSAAWQRITGGKMKLCCKHRTMAQWSPAQAELMWQRLMQMGRQKLDQQLWCEAVGIYGSAFETAEILLMLGDDDRSLEMERYKRTALEFIYCLRNSHYLVDFEGLIAMIHDKLIHEDERQPFSKSLASVINSLSDAAFSPLAEVQEWMNMPSYLSEKHSVAVH